MGNRRYSTLDQARKDIEILAVQLTAVARILAERAAIIAAHQDREREPQLASVA